MTKSLSDEELAALDTEDVEMPEPEEGVAASEEGEVIEIEEDDDEGEGEPNILTSGQEPVKRTPSNQKVPYDRFAEVNQENQKLREMLGNLTEVVKQSQRPAAQAAPHRPTYVRPDDTPDKRQWREFVAETVDPVVSARLAELEAQAKQRDLAIQEHLDLQATRAKFSDYGDYEAEVDQLRAQFYQGTGIAVPREYAYHVARSMRSDRQKSVQKRNRVIKRAAPAASGGNAPPAREGVKTGRIVLNNNTIPKLSLKQMEQILSKTNARI